MNKTPDGSVRGQIDRSAGQEGDDSAELWPEGHYNLRLYVAGQTAKSAAAIANLRRLCEVHLAGCHTVEVIDLSKDPGRAAADQIVALPTLVRRLPPPIKRIIGSLADTEKVLMGLEIQSLKQ
ncbi:MAG TPA: circadian clock KaiB family protein [Afipia sp.]